MSLFSRRLATAFLVLTLFGAACGSDDSASSSNSNGFAADVNESLPPPGVSKDIGIQCLNDGDMACAKRNLCAIQGDPSAGFRCCLAGFLDNYFSENTRALGEMLGYDPVDFAQVKTMSRDELIKAKALPFAELFLLGQDEAPGVKDLLKRWAIQLIDDKAATAELQSRLESFGAGLESTAACLDLTMGSLREDQIDAAVFGTQDSYRVAPRDLQFLRFALGMLGYALQTGANYEWGAEHFPSLPLNDAFLADINGFAGEGDARFGELDAISSDLIAQKFPLLQGSFAALQAYSALKGEPGKIDAWLNWRFSKESQEKASEWLKAMNASLLQKNWQNLPGGEYQINLSSLGVAGMLPNSAKLDAKLPFLSRDAAGDIDVNGDFLLEWAQNLVKTSAP